MSNESLHRKQEHDIIKFIKQKMKENRKEADEVIDTLFYMATKPYTEYFIIAEEYSIADCSFPCDVYASGESIDQCLSDIYTHVKNRHKEAYKLRALVEEQLGETMNKPIQYIKGYIVTKGADISPFSIYSPREKSRYEWVKQGWFSQKEIEVKNDLEKNEFDTPDAFYKYNIDHIDLDLKQLQNAKFLIVRSVKRDVSISEEMFTFRNLERIWDEANNLGEMHVDNFENFLKELHDFKQNASPEIVSLLDDISNKVSQKRSVLNQYELYRKHNDAGLIYFY